MPVGSEHRADRPTQARSAAGHHRHSAHLRHAPCRTDIGWVLYECTAIRTP
ncbi:hypothetical protein I548_2708 [Mycobacterium intracellulare]|nr:hypothetical protein I548_2708 [Mycobacterium intracellulare]